MTHYYYIGQRLAQYRKRDAISIDGIAAHLQVPPPQVVLWLADRLPVVDVLVDKLARLFGVERVNLINEQGQFRNEQEQQISGFLSAIGELDAMPELLHMVQAETYTRDTAGKGLQEKELAALLRLVKRRHERAHQ